MRLLAVLALSVLPQAAQGTVEVSVCYNYGCLNQARVVFSGSLLESIGRDLAEAADAADERQRLARAVGLLYREAGRQSPIHVDRAGDYLDEGVHGKMDCIDHAASTSRLLELLQARGMLRFHRVVEQARRTRFVIFQHFSAVLEEHPPSSGARGDLAAARFVIDSWFVEHGEAAVVLPLGAWLDGEGPNVQ